MIYLRRKGTWEHRKIHSGQLGLADQVLYVCVQLSAVVQRETVFVSARYPSFVGWSSQFLRHPSTSTVSPCSFCPRDFLHQQFAPWQMCCSTLLLANSYALQYISFNWFWHHCFGDKVLEKWVFLLEWISLYHHWFHLLDVALVTKFNNAAAFCYGLRVFMMLCPLRTWYACHLHHFFWKTRKLRCNQEKPQQCSWFLCDTRQSTFHLHCSVYVFQCMVDTDPAKRHLTFLDTEMPLVELCPDVQISLYSSSLYISLF